MYLHLLALFSRCPSCDIHGVPSLPFAVLQAPTILKTWYETHFCLHLSTVLSNTYKTQSAWSVGPGNSICPSGFVSFCSHFHVCQFLSSKACLAVQEIFLCLFQDFPLNVCTGKYKSWPTSQRTAKENGNPALRSSCMGSLVNWSFENFSLCAVGWVSGCVLDAAEHGQKGSKHYY